ncbi:MAG: riboflavin synthase [Mariprofundaceae bacterium]|nr:riboflavin synthase [Mariprofundaceae bacterium]
MFTGIIQDVGSIVMIDAQEMQTHMCFATKLDMQSWAVGDSVAVNGCCLTITAFPKSQQFQASLSLETLKCTSFGQLTEGSAVNLEPALRVGDPLGGHMVSGHVDELSRIVSMDAVGEHICLRISLSDRLLPMVAAKGSVCIHGVSLTVNTVHEDHFSVNLIPHTLEVTTLGQLKAADVVNIEIDLMARYAQRLLAAHLVGKERT